MKFKLAEYRDQLEKTDPLLQEIATYMDSVSVAQTGKELIITRVSEKVAGESGVHTDLRAFDARIEYVGNFGKIERYYTDEEVKKIVDYVNSTYPRKDGKLTCMAHRFKNGKLHFHVQVPLTKREK